MPHLEVLDGGALDMSIIRWYHSQHLEANETVYKPYIRLRE